MPQCTISSSKCRSRTRLLQKRKGLLYCFYREDIKYESQLLQGFGAAGKQGGRLLPGTGCRNYGADGISRDRAGDCGTQGTGSHLQGNEREVHERNMLFPVGEPNSGFVQYFTGRSYLAPLSAEQMGIFNVTFEPGCRNNWHIHHAASGGGQILICVGGRGYYQEWGKVAQELNPGDVVNIPVGVKHWHGAAPDSWFSHLAVEVPGTEVSNEWLEAVDDASYGCLK